MKNKGLGTLIKTAITLFAFFLILSPLIAVRLGAAFADNAETAEKRHYIAKSDGYFADDKILVVMNDDADNIVTYTVTDFPEAEFTEVKDLTQYLKDMMRNGNKEAENDGIFKRENFKSILRLTLKNKGKQNVLNAIHILEKRSDIISAEPDHTMQPQSVPNDKYYSSGDLWALNGKNGIHADEAWKITTGSSNVRVGVLDTGIDASHPDLINVVNKELSREFSFDYESDEIAKDDPFLDMEQHGTHVAGIIGAQGNNSIGIVGVNHSVEIVSLKITLDAKIYASNLVSAIAYAIANRIQVLNHSIGFEEKYYDKFFASKAESVEWILYNYGGLFVMSAGNYGINIDNKYLFPTCIEGDNIIVVGAIDSHGKRWSNSNYGKNVDIYAPGEDIISTVPINAGQPDYLSKSGTSMAAPFVSGVAALLLSQVPDLTGAELKELIINTADVITISLPNGTTQQVKKLNAFKAVSSYKS